MVEVICKGCNTADVYPSRRKARLSGWFGGSYEMHCPVCAPKAQKESKAKAAQFKKQTEIREIEFNKKWFEALQLWPGNRRVARYVENRLGKAKVIYRRVDATSGSIYFYTENSKMRIANHKAKIGGGFAGQDALGDIAYDEPTYSINPLTFPNWREIVEDVINLYKKTDKGV